MPGVTPVLSLDCEMVGVGPDGTRSALARVCIVNEQGNVLLDVHCKPKERVTDYRWGGGHKMLVGAGMCEGAGMCVWEVMK